VQKEIMSIKQNWIEYIKTLQNDICIALEELDGERFIENVWMREDGGGGSTKVIQNGNVFEKGGVNTSTVFGNLPATMQQAFNVGESNFFAAGISIVIHPKNPYVFLLKELQDD
jgi:coproporphyrinogen III oxidase